MKQFRFQFVWMSAALLLAALSSTVGTAQVHGGAMPNRVPTKQPKRPDKDGKQAPARPSPGQHPLDYWSSLPKEQRDTQLERMAPKRAENIRSGVERWNNMTPEQKEVARSMTPEKRQLAADHRAWLQQQPPERQKAIVHQTQLLRQMSPEARQVEMNSPTFKHRFDPAEREHIKKVISIIPEGQATSIE